MRYKKDSENKRQGKKKAMNKKKIDCVFYNDCFSSPERKRCWIHHIEVIPHSFGVYSGIRIGCVWNKDTKYLNYATDV